MWYIFIAVLAVIAVMLSFLVMAIRLLAAQARSSLDSYFMKNLKVYEELAENRNRDLQVLEAQIAGEERRLAQLKQQSGRLEEVRSLTGGAKQPGGGSAVLSMVQAVYRDTDFMEDYAYVRQHMRFSTEEILNNVKGRISFEEDERVPVYEEILKKFSGETLYGMITLPEEDQEEILETMLAPSEQNALRDYLREEGGGRLDLLEFMEYLKNYVRSHQNVVHIRRGKLGSFKAAEGSNVVIEEDASIHEGLKIIYKNQLYDYSI